MIITLTGTNDFTLDAELHRLVDGFIIKYSDIGVEHYDGQELDPVKLPSIIQAVPFLADKRLVVLRQPSSQKALQESLEQLLSTVADSTDLIIVEPRPDKRTSYYKALQKQSDLRSYNQMAEPELASWLAAQAKAQNGSLSLADARYLVQRVGLNQQLLNNELQKLLDYHKAITHQAIDQLTEPSPQSTVFSLLDAAFHNNASKVVQLYQEQRQLKVEPLAILALIAWQLHIFALIKTAGQRSAGQIAKEAGLSPYVVQKSQVLAANFSRQELQRWVSDAAQLDVQLKSRPIDADEALLHYLLKLA